VALVLAACGAFAQALPTGWLDVPFGAYTTAYPGGSAHGGDTFTVVGSGNDMWSADNDGGRFVFQPLLGDCEVIANVKRPTDAALAYAARAGVLIQQRNDRGSLHMLFARMRGDVSNIGRLSASGRLALYASPASKSENGHLADWLLLRLIRQGNTVRAYFSTNAVWELYSTLTVPMGEAVNAGIFVSRGSASAAQLMTNEFNQVRVRQLVTVNTHATAGLDVSWATDLPGVSNGWDYTYTVTRTQAGGTPEELVSGLTTNVYTDADAAAGAYYRYAVTAVPVPQDPLPLPPNVPLGASAATRLPYAVTNLMPGLPQGLFANYYSPTGAPLPVLTRVDASVTHAAAAWVAGTNIYYRTVYNAGLLAGVSDVYTFLIGSDDGLRLWVGDALVIDNWYGGSYEGSSTPVWLEAGRSYPIRIEYFQNTGGRVCTLAWRRAGEPEVIAAVPVSAFSPVPLPWRHEDVGDVKLNGNAAFDLDTGAVTVRANGNALTNAADACHLISRDAAGDFDLSVRLDSLTGEGANRLAGLVARNDLTPGSAGVALLAAPGASTYAVSVVTRGSAGANPTVSTADTGVATASPLWLRLTCSGQTVNFFYRAHADTAWTEIGPAARPFANACKIGLAASSADDAGAVEAAFSGLQSGVYPANALSPSQDAYLRSDNLNYGADVLYVKRSTGNTQREVFMRFGVAGQAGLRSAVLRLYLMSRDASPAVQQVIVRGLPALNWNEMTATWTNAPGGLRLPTVFLADDDPTLVTRKAMPTSGAQYVDFDVTPAVRAAAAGTGDLTLHLYNTEILPGGSITFASKEYATAAYRPALVCTYDAPQGVAADGGPEAGGVTVTWQAYAGAGAYRVYRADAADGAYAPVGGSVTNPVLKDTGRTAGQRYYYKVSALTGDGETEVSAAVSACAAAASATVYADEDAHVEGNGTTRTSADTNYGNVTSLTIKYNATAHDFHREAYLLFNDIAGLGHVERAVLRVMPSTASGGDILPSQIPVQIVRMPSNDWNEATVTFNNHPGAYPPPTPILNNQPEKNRVTVLAQAINTVMEVDVTEIVREAARVNADNKLSLGVIRTDTQGGFNLSLYSSEQTDVNRKPRLIYTLGRPRAPAASAANGYVTLSWLPYRGATGYVVRRAEAADGTYAALASTTDTACKDLAAEAGKTYYYTLAAVTAGGETETSLAASACVQAPGEERYPVADTYIESNGGTTTTTSHGADAVLNLKRSPVREDLFKFDVTGLENVSGVRFRTYANAQSTGYTPVSIIVRAGDFGDWSERATTYANPPAGYTPPSVSTAAKGSNELARIVCPYKDPGTYDNCVEADVTEAVRQAARDGKRYVTLFLTGDDTLQSDNGQMNVPSREYGTLLKRPVLLCSGSRFGAPQGLRVESKADAPGFLLTWRAVAGADRYIVTRHGPADADAVVVASDVTGTSYLDADAAFWTDRTYTYSVTAVNADGTVSQAAQVEEALTRTFTRPIVADTFVRGGPYTNDTYALSALVDLKGDGNLEYQREGFFRVAVSNVPEVVKAQLRLKLNSTNTFTDSTIVLKEAADTGWVESGSPAATWNNVLGPGAGRTPDPGDDPSVIARFNLKASGYGPGDDMFFDMTRQLKAAQARAADTLLVQMFITTLSGEGNISVRSLQALNTADAPYVLYTVARNPAPGTVLLLK
jgi:fibronectin type 3 domain-containing protein